MADRHEQELENDVNTLLIVCRGTISEMDISMEDSLMIDECLKRIETENGNETCSKESLLPLDNETQDLICQLHDLVLQVSSTTFNFHDVNCKETSNQRGTEDIVPIVIENTMRKCENSSTTEEHIKTNHLRVEQQSRSAKNNIVSQKNALKRPNSYTSVEKKVNKKSKRYSGFSVKLKYKTKSSCKCMKSLNERKRNNFVKKQKEFKKCRQNRKDHKQKNYKNEKKLKKVTGKLQMIDCKQEIKHKKQKLKKVKSKPQLKYQKNNKHRNGHVKKASKTKSVTSIIKTSVSCHSSRNKRQEFHHRNSKLRKQSTRNNPTEKKKRSWCSIM